LWVSRYGSIEDGHDGRSTGLRRVAGRDGHPCAGICTRGPDIQLQTTKNLSASCFEIFVNAMVTRDQRNVYAGNPSNNVRTIDICLTCIRGECRMCPARRGISCLAVMRTCIQSHPLCVVDMWVVQVVHKAAMRYKEGLLTKTSSLTAS
jgi:hypothetical protein